MEEIDYNRLENDSGEKGTGEGEPTEGIGSGIESLYSPERIDVKDAGNNDVGSLDVLKESLNLAVEQDTQTKLNLNEKDVKKNDGRGQYNRFSTEKKELFLKYLSKFYPNVWKACTLAGIHKTTVLNHMQRDQEFAQACADIADQVMDEVEGHMQTFAATPKGFLDRIAILKANRPEKWNPTSKVEISHRREDPAALEARRSVLTRIVTEDQDVIEAVTGKHVPALPAAPDREPELDTMAPEPVDNQPTPAEPKIDESSNARAGVRSDQRVDIGLNLPHTERMKLNPFDLAGNRPPKKTKLQQSKNDFPPSPPSQNSKRGKVHDDIGEK